MARTRRQTGLEASSKGRRSKLGLDIQEAEVEAIKMNSPEAHFWKMGAVLKPVYSVSSPLLLPLASWANYITFLDFLLALSSLVYSIDIQQMGQWVKVLLPSLMTEAPHQNPCEARRELISTKSSGTSTHVRPLKGQSLPACL